MRRTVLLGWALAASLAVNAGALGYFVHDAVFDDRRGGLRAVAAELSPEGRDHARAMARAARPALRAARNTLRTAQVNTVAILADPDADADARNAQLERSRAALADLHSAAQTLLFDIAEGLSAEDRAVFAAGLKAHAERSPRWWRTGTP